MSDERESLVAPPGEGLFQDLLRRMVDIGATDLHLKTGLPPVVRVGSHLKMLSKQISALNKIEMFEICNSLLAERHKKDFASGNEIDLAYSLSKVGRFRINIYRYRSQYGIVVRYIPLIIRSISDLGLPEVIRQIAMAPRGLVLVTGTTGSGKSTTLAAMINEWNQRQSGHVVTIEDPIEYIIKDNKSIITQREVGIDTSSFSQGLRNALRQDPNVIMIGELRDRDTIQTALNAAETGHLVLSTIHTKDALETVNRVIGVFPPEAQQEVRWQFASCLTAIVSQRMLPAMGSDESKVAGRVLAVEVMVNTPRIRDLLLDPLKYDRIRGSIEQGHLTYGMQTFDQHLMQLLKNKKITRETALKSSSSPADFELKLRGINSSDGAKWAGFDKNLSGARASENVRESQAPTILNSDSSSGVSSGFGSSLELDDYPGKKKS